VTDGRIVLTASQAAHQGGGPTGVAYGAFKAAVIGLMKTAAAEGARLGITCNAIAPGAIDTAALTTTNAPPVVEAMKRRVPLGRIGRPEEIAATVAFLVSSAAGYINGATIDVNGGGLMR
jgi:3-oxoacyl-[acyl-carrier protein] reductase